LYHLTSFKYSCMDEIKKIKELREKVIEKLKTIYDPEILANIYDLGLIYGVDVDKEGNTFILMTFTSPNCPAIQSMPDEIKEKTSSIDEIAFVEIEITWEPPWNENMMTEEAKLEAGLL
jgi:FeS assembly SUF system protein